MFHLVAPQGGTDTEPRGPVAGPGVAAHPRDYGSAECRMGTPRRGSHRLKLSVGVSAGKVERPAPAGTQHDGCVHGGVCLFLENSTVCQVF